MSTNWIIFIVSVGLALTISFVCSLLEAALLSLTPGELAYLRRRHPRVGEICRQLKQNINRSIAVVLILNTAAHTIGASFGGAEFAKIFGDSYLVWFSLILTLIMVQYTEILPKTLGVKFNRQILQVTALPISYLIKILQPLIHLIHWLNRPFESKSSGGKQNTAEEITALAAMARSSHEISSRQERIIRSAPLLSDLTVEQVMLPEEKISMVSSSFTISEALNFVMTDFHTRYPVCENGDRNQIVGYINLKELVAVSRINPDRAKLSDITRPINFAEPGDTAADLLEKIVTHHCHLSIIRDPANKKTLGMVTQEDIIEELLGDLDDEFDPLPRTFYAQGDGFWIVGGGIPVSLLARETHLELPRRMEPVSAWFDRELKRIPRVGDSLRFKHAEFVVRKIRRGRVFELAVKKI